MTTAPNPKHLNPKNKRIRIHIKKEPIIKPNRMSDMEWIILNYKYKHNLL